MPVLASPRLNRGALSLLLLYTAVAVCWAPVEARFVQTGAKKPLYSSLVASQWKFSLPESVLQKTFLQQGSTARLKKVLESLLMGETVHIGAVGGSVTFASADPKGGGYFGRTLAWMRQAFPKANIIQHNGAIRGSTTMFVEHHLSSCLEPDVDLVFIEYAINAAYNSATIFYDDIASYERILRSVLSGSHAPPATAKPAAALMVNMWRCCRFNGTHHHLLAYEDTSNYLSILAQYYSVPTISVRNGMHHAYRVGQGLFTNIFREYPEGQNHVMIHPSADGHQYMADIVVYAFYMVLAQMEQHGITEGDIQLLQEAMPPPMVAFEYRQILGSWNSEATTKVVSGTSGWDKITEAGNYGYQTSTPGASLTIKLDTRVPDHLMQRIQQDLAASPASLRKLQVVVYLGLLQSYEHMGIVQVTCIQGCTCKPIAFDTSKVPRNASVTHPYPVPVSGSQECTLELRCDSHTSSGEHKVALRGVSVVASAPMKPPPTAMQQIA